MRNCLLKGLTMLGNLSHRNLQIGKSARLVLQQTFVFGVSSLELFYTRCPLVVYRLQFLKSLLRIVFFLDRPGNLGFQQINLTGR